MALLSGGCNASRASFAAACLAALPQSDNNSSDALGFIPEIWKEKTSNFEKISDLAKKIALLRGDKPSL